MKKNMKWVENMAQSQYSALQKQYESMQQFNDNLHDKSMGSLKTEYLAARERGRGRSQRETRKADSIAQTCAGTIA